MAAERLQKLLARAGVASRRACEEIILAGRVTVDGQVVIQLGAKADAETQDVRLDGSHLRFERPEYWLLNKPTNVVCTNYDPSGRKRPIDLMKNSRARLFPVGRLDADSRGLLIMTNDGEFAQLLMHPRYEIPKTYLATVGGEVTTADVRRLRGGVYLSDGRMRVGFVRVLRRGRNKSLVEVTIREGRNRQVRRMLAHLGHEVKDLVRTRIGPVVVRGLGVGSSRPLTVDEVAALRRMSENPPPERPATRRPAREAAGESREEDAEQEAGARALPPRRKPVAGRRERPKRDRGPERPARQAAPDTGPAPERPAPPSGVIEREWTRADTAEEATGSVPHPLGERHPEAAPRSRKPFQKDERKPFRKAGPGGRKPYRQSGRGERTPYREGATGERRPYRTGDSRERRLYREGAPGERKPYREGGAGERKPYRPSGSGERKPYRPSGPGERRPYREGATGERRPYRPSGSRERKPYREGASGERKPYRPSGPGERKPYRPSGSGERKPYRAAGQGERKPYRPSGPGERKPYREGGAGERKPYREGEQRVERKPFRREESHGAKPQGAKPRGAKPPWFKEKRSPRQHDTDGTGKTGADFRRDAPGGGGRGRGRRDGPPPHGRRPHRNPPQ
jgi:23S rRNA pseudouridine2605 synthase